MRYVGTRREPLTPRRGARRTRAGGGALERHWVRAAGRRGAGRRRPRGRRPACSSSASGPRRRAHVYAGARRLGPRLRDGGGARGPSRGASPKLSLDPRRRTWPTQTTLLRDGCWRRSAFARLGVRRCYGADLDEFVITRPLGRVSRRGARLAPAKWGAGAAILVR